MPGHVKILIEIKGFSTHVRDMDRQKYCNELNRETFLYAMGYQVISFAYDDVEQRPDLCSSLLRMVLSKYQATLVPISPLLLKEKEVIRLALGLVHPLRPKDVELHFEVHHRTAVHLLQQMCDKGWLLPSYRGNQKRIVRYELARGVLDYFD